MFNQNLSSFSRRFSTCVSHHGLRNQPDHPKIFFETDLVFRNKRHLREHKKKVFTRFSKPNEFPDIPIHNYGCRGTGIRHHKDWRNVPEMVPELIVPDLTDCKLKPYVSYRAHDLRHSEFTSKDLFNVHYGKKMLIEARDKKKKNVSHLLNENVEKISTSCEPPSKEEVLRKANDAFLKARKTGSDYFIGGTPKSRKFNVRWDYGLLSLQP